MCFVPCPVKNSHFTVSFGTDIFNRCHFAPQHVGCFPGVRLGIAQILFRNGDVGRGYGGLFRERNIDQFGIALGADFHPMFAGRCFNFTTGSGFLFFGGQCADTDGGAVRKDGGKCDIDRVCKANNRRMGFGTEIAVWEKPHFLFFVIDRDGHRIVPPCFQYFRIGSAKDPSGNFTIIEQKCQFTS